MKELARQIMILAVALAGAAPAADAGGSRENQSPACSPSPPAWRGPIVNGHRVQPRPSDFDHPEFTPEQTREVEELYLQIMRMRHGKSGETDPAPKGAGDQQIVGP